MFAIMQAFRGTHAPISGITISLVHMIVSHADILLQAFIGALRNANTMLCFPARTQNPGMHTRSFPSDVRPSECEGALPAPTNGSGSTGSGGPSST